jgi:polycystin 2
LFSFRLFYEFPPTGGVIPGVNFATVKLLKYVTAYDYAVLGTKIA